MAKRNPKPENTTAQHSTNSVSDEELIELVRSQDKELYRELVERYQNKLLRYAERFVDTQSAQDIVQQAFIKAYINLNSFDTKRKFSSWIYRIVHNEAINLLKKFKREVKINPDYLENIKDEKLNEIDRVLAKREEQSVLLNNLNKLPIDYKSPMMLYYFEEKSYKEISDILRIPIGTVSTRINRGKHALKKIYAEQNE